MAMASALGKFAVATARSSGTSSNIFKSLNNALHRLHPSVLTQIRASPNCVASLVRALATAAAPKKRATNAKAKAKPTTKKTTTVKKAAPRKVAKKAAPKKKPVKKKPAVKKPLKRKVLSEKQKEALAKKKASDVRKKLVGEALSLPKLKSTSPYSIYVSQQYNKVPGVGVAEKSKAVAQQYKSLTPHEIEELNIVAVENKAENDKIYSAWLKQHTPEQIRLANKARSTLRRTTAKITGKSVSRKPQYKKIPDSRQVKGTLAPFLHYYSERTHAGVFKNIKASEAVKLASEEFKSLSTSEAKKYHDLSEADKTRYAREYQSTYGHPPPSKAKKAAAAA